MSRFLRINSCVVHVPSLANVSMTTNCMGSPRLCLYYHTQKTQIMRCGNYEETEKQMMRIKAAMKTIETALEGIPLVEPDQVSVSLEQK
jgi:hypothetical protein